MRQATIALGTRAAQHDGLDADNRQDSVELPG
jgi:hypothetical protein